MVNKVLQATCLGCKLNNKGDGTRELSARIAECMAVFKRLDLFWLRGDSGVRFKLHVYDAVIRSKLVYGLESIQLNATALNKAGCVSVKRPKEHIRNENNLRGQSKLKQRSVHKSRGEDERGEGTS